MLRPRDRKAPDAPVEPQPAAPAAPPAGAERRSHRRSAVAWHGRIMIAGAPSVACVVLNVSERGAKLRLRLPIDLPGGFILAIDRFGELSVEVLDQMQGVVRVGFLDEPETIKKFFRYQLPAFRQAQEGA